MKISNHWLVPDSTSEKIVVSKTANAGDLIDPDYVVIHYTATDTARPAIDWFMNTGNNPDRIAAHIVLDYDGTITQLVPFNRKANHAGTSTWDGVDFFNSHAIGIEIVNPGFVEKISNGSFRRTIAQDKSGNPVFKTYPATESSRIVKANHKHKFWVGRENKNWFTYPDAQLVALYKLCRLLFETYHPVTAVGHDDISPARKPDPGPAFPWEAFKTNVFGSTNKTGKIFIVNTEGSNLRTSFSTSAPVIKKLALGYEVGLIETNGQWSKVYLVDKQQDVLLKQGSKLRSIKTIGWIFSALVTEKVS
ncbi:MAG: N-acetylmuramoyl-L-alanine amidase [Chitinophagaceae bacterium]|nr:N-acetylmuramoyl-L-alanine amidase [Chitinophagaceae bacterium]